MTFDTHIAPEIERSILKHHPSSTRLEAGTRMADGSLILQLENADVAIFIHQGNSASSQSPVRWLDLCVERNSPARKAITKGLLKGATVIFNSIKVDGGKVNLRCIDKFSCWDDLFPNEEMPSFEIIRKSMTIGGGLIEILHEVEWDGLVQHHVFTFPLAVLSNSLIDSIKKTCQPPLSVPHGFRVTQDGSLVSETLIADWDISKIDREDPYLGQVRRFGCVKCGVSTFGLSIDRVCHECSGDKSSITGGQKSSLIEEIKSVASSEITDKNWKDLDEKVRGLIEQWKASGGAGLKENALWGEFNSYVRLFFEAKDKFFEKRKIEREYNVQYKKEIIRKAQTLLSTDNANKAWKEMNVLFNDWRTNGKNCGKDIDMQMWDEFKTIRDELFKGISKQKIDLQDEFVANKNKKLSIIQEALTVAESTAWSDGTTAMHQLMDKWRSIGRCGKDIDSDLWGQFNDARQLFFSRRKAYFEEREQTIAKRIADKENLISRAMRLSVSTDWRGTSNELRELFDEWKAIGGTGVGEDDLWARFCAARQAFFDAMITSQHAAKIEKERLISEARHAVANLPHDEAASKLVELTAKWKEAGVSGKKDDDALWSLFCQIRTFEHQY